MIEIMVAVTVMTFVAINILAVVSSWIVRTPQGKPDAIAVGLGLSAFFLAGVVFSVDAVYVKQNSSLGMFWTMGAQMGAVGGLSGGIMVSWIWYMDDVSEFTGVTSSFGFDFQFGPVPTVLAFDAFASLTGTATGFRVLFAKGFVVPYTGIPLNVSGTTTVSWPLLIAPSMWEQWFEDVLPLIVWPDSPEAALASTPSVGSVIDSKWKEAPLSTLW